MDKDNCTTDHTVENSSDQINGANYSNQPGEDDSDSDTFEMSYKNLNFSEMDFEQTYTMYSNLQQKKALNVMDQLQKVQLLNQQYCTNFAPYEQPNEIRDGFAPSKDSHPRDEPRDEFDQFFSNTESNALEKFLDNLANPNGSTNPMHMYNNGQSNYQHDFPMFELHTMKAPVMPTPPQHSISPCESHIMEQDFQEVMGNNTKKDLSDAFGHPSMKSIPTVNQLPTPLDSRQSSTSFGVPCESEQGVDHDSLHNALLTPETGSPGTKKRKRSCHKPLLTLEQKRLNHSLSEQKRRQLCKLAYERCVRLVTNINDYSETSGNDSRRKSKKRQINKDGLPNLSKHTALTKITNEMTTIKRQNDGLKKLLGLE